MKRVPSILLSMLLVSSVQAQQPFAALREIVRQELGEEAHMKCGTPLLFEIRRRSSEYPVRAMGTIGQIQVRPTMQTSRLSPSGRFRIHYDTTGVNQPRMLAGNPLNPVAGSHEEYVDSVGSIFDHCRDVEVDILGFRPPPPDGTSGGGAEYDIYVRDQAPDVFGFTSWDGEAQLESGVRDRYVTFIEIDNDFLAQRTKGLDGLRVTAAHEFHHAMQVGVYGIWNTVPNADFYFYELTSVWLEEVVYGDVNDYYFDLPGFLQNFKDPSGRSLGFSTFTFAHAGYERSIWAQYLARRFGGDVMRRIWEEILSHPPLESMDIVLADHGINLRSAFAEFSAWNMFTGSRADTVRYYPEGNKFPMIIPNTTAAFNGSSVYIQGEAFPLSAQYYAFVVQGDTILADVSNVSHESAYSDPGLLSGLRLNLSRTDASGAVQKLANGFVMGLEAEPIEDWRTLYISSVSELNLNRNPLPSPNPMRLQEASSLLLPAEGSSPGPATVFVLTATFDLVFSGSYSVVDRFGKPTVTVPSRDLAGSVSSGIHFVFLKTAQREYRWKVAFVR